MILQVMHSTIIYSSTKYVQNEKCFCMCFKECPYQAIKSRSVKYFHNNIFVKISIHAEMHKQWENLFFFVLFWSANNQTVHHSQQQGVGQTQPGYTLSSLSWLNLHSVSCPPTSSILCLNTAEPTVQLLSFTYFSVSCVRQLSKHKQ